MGQSVSTELRIVNNSHSAIRSTTVSELDKFDWKGRADRPDHNFQGLYIASGSFVQRREAVSSLASNCPFTMTLTFADGSQDTFRIYQKFAIGQRKSGFKHSAQSHDIAYRREGDNTLVIEVKDTQAEQLNREGLALQGEGRLQEAAARFEAALGSATHARTAASIGSNRASCQQLMDDNQRAEQLMREALALQQQGKLQDCAAKLEEAQGLAKLPGAVAAVRELKAACKDQTVLGLAGQQARVTGLEMQREGRTEESAGFLELADGMAQLARAVAAAQKLPSAFDELLANKDSCVKMSEEALMLSKQGETEQAAAKLEQALALAKLTSPPEEAAQEKPLELRRREEQARESARTNQQQGKLTEAARCILLAKDLGKVRIGLEFMQKQVSVWEELIASTKLGIAVWKEGLVLARQGGVVEYLDKLAEATALIRDAECKFVYENTALQQEMGCLNQRAERLNAEALALQQRGQLAAAAAAFERALELAVEPQSGRCVRWNRAECLRLLAAAELPVGAAGQLLLEQWRLEQGGAGLTCAFDCI